MIVMTGMTVQPIYPQLPGTAPSWGGYAKKNLLGFDACPICGELACGENSRRAN